MTTRVPFKWDADKWYRMKLRVDHQKDGTARVRGKVWAADGAEPEAWTIEKIDKIPHLVGSPGIYADGISDVYFDNVKVYRNQMMRRFILSSGLVVIAASAAVSATDWPMWGGTPSRNMVSPMTGLPTTWDVKTGKNVKWVAELGSQSYGNPVVAGGVVLVGTNNEAMRDPKQGGDRGVLMAFREETGEFMWQATFEKLAAGPRQRLAVPGHRQLAAGHPRRRLLHDQPRHDRRRGPAGLSRQRERRAGQGREADRQGRPRHHLDVRHDRGGRRVPAQPRQLLAGVRRQPAVLQHRQRPGRKPRQRAVAEGAVDHRARHRERHAEVGRQLGRRSGAARPVVDARGRRHRRRAAGGARARRRLGARLRSHVGQEAVGVRHQPEGLGVAEDAQRSDQHAGDLRERRLHFERPGSGTR